MTYEKEIAYYRANQDHMGHLRKRMGRPIDKINLMPADEVAIEWAVAQVEKLTAEVARLRSALESVEWIDDLHGHEGAAHCPQCFADQPSSHEPYCQIGKALGRPGCAILEAADEPR